MIVYRNGRWRSQWSVTFPESGGTAEMTGILKLQVGHFVQFQYILFSIFLTPHPETLYYANSLVCANLLD